MTMPSASPSAVVAARLPALLRRPRHWVLACVGIYIAAALLWLLLAGKVSQPQASLSSAWSDVLLVFVSAAALYALLSHTARHVQLHTESSAQSESRLRHLLHSMDGAAWFASPDGSMLHFVSPKFEQLLGQAPDARAGMPARWHDRIHPADMQAVESAHRRLDQDGSVSLQYRIVRADGEQRWVDDWTHLIRDEGGQVVGLGGVLQDITERRELQRAHLQTRQRLEAIIESAMDAIITVDAWQRVVVFNDAAARLLGVAAKAAMGEPLERFIPQDFRASHARHMARFAQDGTTLRSMGHLTTLVALRADGTTIPIEAAVSRSGQGDEVLMTVVMRDAAPQRAAELARLAQAQAEAANRAKTEFLSRVSHELRTPLNAVVGLAQVMLGDTRSPLSTAQRQHLDHIEQAGWHLLALINETLDLSSIEAGQLNLTLEAVDLDRVVGEASAMCQTLAEKHQVSVLHETCADPATRTRADTLRLRQIVINLLSNAIKYNRAGGQVRLHVAAEGADMVLRVEDTGAGMSESQLAHLFEPFNRLGRDGSGVDGLGMGLVVTRSLVELMGGSLRLSSHSGQGTIAVVRLPRAAGADRPAETLGVH